MKGLVRFSVNHPVAITMLVGVIMVMGLLSLSRMGQDFIPDISFPTVTVVTNYQGASPEEVEKLVTEPVEGVCAAISGAQKVSSSSSEGVSTVTLEFEWGTDIDVASQDVREKLSMVEKYLPEDADKPAVYKFDPSQIPVMEYALSSDKYTPTQMKKAAEDIIKPRLERQEGVASVYILGVEDEQVVVDVDMAKLREQGLSLGEVINLLRAQNLNLPAGHYMIGPEEYLIRAVGEVKNPDELLQLPVGFAKSGRPVRLAEVAKVWTGIMDQRSYYGVEENPGILVIVMKQSGSNVVKVAERAKREMKALEPLLPAGIEIIETFDMSQTVQNNNRNTFDTAWQGSLLAAIILFLFLMNWRPTLVISLAIPTSIIASFIVMQWRGDTLNMMTLGGLTLAAGMLIDNAVVVIENVFRHMEEGEDRKTATVNGASEVGLAITASTLTNVVVFLPLIYSGGVVGELMKSLAITVTITMLMSLFVAVTIIPSYGAQLFRAKKTREEYGKGLSAWFRYVARAYRALLEWVLRHRILTTGVTVVLLAFSIFTYTRLGGEFMPRQDMTFVVTIEVKLPSGTPPDATKAYLEQGMRVAKTYPEVKTVALMVGSGGFASAFGMTADVNEGMLQLVMKPTSERKGKMSTETAEEIIDRFPPYFGAKVGTTNHQAEMMGGGAPVEIHIYGDDVEVLARLGQDVLDRIKGIPGVIDPDVSLELAKPETRIVIDHERAAYYGLTAYQIEAEVEAATKGKMATRMEIGGDQLDVVVRGDPVAGVDLGNLWIKSSFGTLVPLSEVATIVQGQGPTKIDRENQVRVVKVTADKSGRSLQAINADVAKAMQGFKVPAGYSWEMSGESKRMADMMTQMFWVLMAASVIIYMIMAALFESFKRPLIVMFTVPVAFMGTAFTMWLTGTVISMISLMGMLIVFGIVVNNAIVMIDLIDQMRNRGVEKYKALVDGAVLRLRPIMITAITAMAGLMPMAFSRGQGWEMRAPIGVALIGGLFTGTFVTLFIIPVVYTWFERVKVDHPTKI